MSAESVWLRPPCTALDWLRIYRLYRKAFPPAERKPFSVIYAMYRRNRTHVWCIFRDRRFAGFAATVNGKDRILLDYLAVSPLLRGQGIGSLALGRLLEQYPAQGIFLEIEDTASPGPDQSLRRKRKQFYLRCGMEALDVRAKVFGVPMELLGRNCPMTFAGYQQFYRDHYSPWAAEHILPQ